MPPRSSTSIFDCSSFRFEADWPWDTLEACNRNHNPSPFVEIGELTSVWVKDALREKYTPTRILRHGPATIVFWQDGTKTIVKRCLDDAIDSPYTAFTAALAIKIFGSNSKLKKMVKTLTEEQK